MKFTDATTTLLLVLLPAVRSVAGAANDSDPQTSLTLDPSVICTGCEQNGQDPPVAGQTASLTSVNNFINFCDGKTLTSGEQVVAGSCNAVPMGQIIPSTSMPAAKISFPVNGGTFPANQAFTFTMNVENMDLGNFVNAEKNYFGAPQQVNNGIVTAHSHVTVQALPAVDSTAIPDPSVFAFFKGLNDKDVNGVLSTPLAAGLPAGVYRFCSMNTAANHQPVNVAIAQHGSLDDCIYATAVDGAANSTAAANNTAADSSAANSTAVDNSAANSTAVDTATANSTAVNTAAANSTAASNTAASSAAATSTAAAAGNKNKGKGKGNGKGKGKGKGKGRGRHGRGRQQ